MTARPDRHWLTLRSFVGVSVNLEVGLVLGTVVAFAQILLTVVLDWQHITLHSVEEKAAIGAQ